MQCADVVNIDDMVRTVDARALRNIMFDFDVIAMRENGELLFARRYKNEPPPLQFWEEVRLDGTGTFVPLTYSICGFCKIVKGENQNEQKSIIPGFVKKVWDEL